MRWAFFDVHVGGLLTANTRLGRKFAPKKSEDGDDE